MSPQNLALFLILGAFEVLGNQAPVTRWGIISAGKISHDFIKAMGLYPESEHKVVAIAARDLHRAQAYADKFNIERAYGSYAELANDPGIDVVYVGTINPFHLPVVKMLLEAGKAVLCEKPLALNTAEVQEMVTLAESKNVLLMEGMYSRFLPSYEFVMEQIANGVIGEVRHVDAGFYAYLMDNPRVVEKELGGGANLDIGVYAVNAILQGFGNIDPVNITAVGVLNEDGVDIATSASLEFPDGKLGTFMVDARGNAPSEAMFLGTKGYIRVSSVGVPETVIVNDKVYEFPLKQEGYNWATAPGLRFQANEIRRCLLSGDIESPRLSHQHSLQSARIVETVFRIISHNTHSPPPNSSCTAYFSTGILLLIIAWTLTSNVF